MAAVWSLGRGWKREYDLLEVRQRDVESEVPRQEQIDAVDRHAYLESQEGDQLQGAGAKRIRYRGVLLFFIRGDHALLGANRGMIILTEVQKLRDLLRQFSLRRVDPGLV